MSTSALTLNCWVLGSPVDRFLQVQVNQRETFKSIVKAIAEARGLDAKAVDAMQLFLVTSSTPIPTDEDEEEKYKELDEGFRQASKAMKPIRSTQDLSALFKEKLDLHMLHLIIKVPRTINLCCVMRTASAPRDSLFFITIDDDYTVDDLRQAISDKKRDRRHEGLALKKNQLAFWAVDLRIDDDRFEENFRNQEFNATTSLKVADQLYTIFPLIDRHCQALHIVVDVTVGKYNHVVRCISVLTSLHKTNLWIWRSVTSTSRTIGHKLLPFMLKLAYFLSGKMIQPSKFIAVALRRRV